MVWDLIKGRFKVGDLVRVVEDVDFALKNITAKQGEVGLILDVEDTFDSLTTYWGVDYVVLIRGQYPLLFFDFELEHVDEKQNKNLNKELDKLKFTFLKY